MVCGWVWIHKWVPNKHVFKEIGLFAQIMFLTILGTKLNMKRRFVWLCKYLLWSLIRCSYEHQTLWGNGYKHDLNVLIILHNFCVSNPTRSRCIEKYSNNIGLLNYRRLLAAWAENNYLKVRLNFLEILDYGAAQNYLNSSGMWENPTNWY